MTPQQLKKLFTWDPTTGRIFWRNKSGRREAFVSVQTKGYLYGKLYGKNYLAHRVLWALEHGAWPALDIDHINQNKQDNRLLNLRQVSKVGNSRNRPLNKNSTSGNLGVSMTRTGKWRSYITCDGRQVHLGVFTSKKDAEAARKKANERYAFSENHGTITQTL